MIEKKLFQSSHGIVTNVDFFNTLKELGAQNADVLYIHSSLNFGVLFKDIKKKELLSELLNVIESLGVKTLIFPTYTFSFPNGKDFDVQKSKTPMGLLNDFVRSDHRVIRSVDPLMSNVLLGERKEFIEDIGVISCGEGSTFDLLHKSKLNVKFIFLGAALGDCFTYMHYIESCVQTPYRYNRDFTGTVINNGVSSSPTYKLFVRYSNVQAGVGAVIYENILLQKRIALKKAIGDSFITVVEEKEAYNTYVELISKYPSFFIEEPFDELGKTKTFIVENMVAL